MVQVEIKIGKKYLLLSNVRELSSAEIKTSNLFYNPERSQNWNQLYFFVSSFASSWTVREGL